jgi:hypothetical protein
MRTIRTHLLKCSFRMQLFQVKQEKDSLSHPKNKRRIPSNLRDNYVRYYDNGYFLKCFYLKYIKIIFFLFFKIYF